MDAMTPLVIPLSDEDACNEKLVGGKVAKLARLANSGCQVPPGFCLTFAAYEDFIRECRLDNAIRLELDRKNLDEMRWEEIWDAALRIRSVFLTHSLQEGLRRSVGEALDGLEDDALLAVRSSALGEDSGNLSFAGLHESLTDVSGQADVESAIRLVWASLWSDAALMYRREIGLDPATSRMAVLVQQMVHTDRSGVAFGQDPRGGSEGRAIVEAVAGPCRLLVDGVSDPDRWEIDRHTRKVLHWRAGQRDQPLEGGQVQPLLDADDLGRILDVVQTVEDLFDWSPDVEWTGRSNSMTLLQARPITTAKPDTDEERSRSLSLRPGDERLRELRDRVADRLIPELQAEGNGFADEPIEGYDDLRLADAIEQRSESLQRWMKIYWDEFIPFAHGVRRLAVYYNDFVRPDDPYEFVGLLQKQHLLATERNQAIESLAETIADNDGLRRELQETLAECRGPSIWSSLRERLSGVAGGGSFIQQFEDLNRRFLDITYDQTRMQEDPEPMLRNLLEISRSADKEGRTAAASTRVEEFEERLWNAVGDARVEEAREMVSIGRLSWKLRDDDNLLVSRVESQLLRALEVAVERLRSAGRVLGDAQPAAGSATAIAGALRDPTSGPVKIARPESKPGETPTRATREMARQLIGQPASRGLASGKLRTVRNLEDLGRFRRGEVLLCDAIQPTMTHLAMLAAAIIERRGGMLIHGAIIARELGIPCVNGIRDATRLLRDGDQVTVDGYLGIVTLGPPELDLELQSAR